MKRGIFFILGCLLLSFVLAGCASSNVSSSSEDTNEREQTNADEQQTKTASTNEENQDEESEQEQEQTETEAGTEASPEPAYKISDVWSIKPIDDANEKVVLLTFDDAPDEHALEIAEELKELDAPAIFFVNGHFLTTDEEKETLKKIYDMGFMIGNHTYSHSDLSELSEEETKEEILRVNDLVKEITGEKPVFFRAPFGINSDYSKKLVKEEGMALMNWSFGYDWESEYQDKDALADIMVNTELLGNGANLLMHDREWTAAAVPDIVNGLREKGYEMVDPDLIKIE